MAKQRKTRPDLKQIDDFLESLSSDNMVGYCVIKRSRNGKPKFLFVQNFRNDKEKGMIANFLTDYLIELVGEEYLVNAFQNEHKELEKKGLLQPKNMYR